MSGEGVSVCSVSEARLSASSSAGTDYGRLRQPVATRGSRTPENGGVSRGHHWPKKLGQNILNFGQKARTAAGIAKKFPQKLGLGIGLRKSANFSRPAAPSASFCAGYSHTTTIESVGNLPRAFAVRVERYRRRRGVASYGRPRPYERVGSNSGSK